MVPTGGNRKTALTPNITCYSGESITTSSRSSRTFADTSDMRRVRDDMPWQLWVVAIIAFWERASFWGITAPWQNYMQHPPHYHAGETPGALGLGQSVATRIYCAFFILYYTAPTLFAIVADSWLGHFTTLVISAIIYCLGCTVLTVSSIPGQLNKGWGLPGLILAMGLIALGNGGFRAIMVPFIADQYTEKKAVVKTLKSGEEVITDRQLTLQYIYSLYFWIGNLGSLSWFLVVWLELHKGFTSAYALCLACMVVAVIMLVTGQRWYTKTPHEGNVLPAATKIIICACRNGFKMAHAQPEYQLKHRQQTVSWNDQLVVEVTRGLQACRVLIAFVVFYLCFDQMQNNLISQAAEMETNGTPNDLVPALNQVGCIVFAPLIQEVLYPFLHRRRIYLRPVIRITIGFCFIASSMLYATIIQHFIYTSPNAKVNVWIQGPLYILMAIGEVFAMVTAMEYAYENSPQRMKAIVQAVSLLIAGVGSAVAMALTPAARNPLMIGFYGGLTGAMAVTTVVFYIIFRNYDRPATKDLEIVVAPMSSSAATGAQVPGAISVSASQVSL
ncbi:MFS general substrate transporter [Didymella exigua CBS 183.55]|uniref:MFS general substrate transporter n=1 Tax=Didymella exigua CBS 183.55 TaxID=1150837 RepID=A0A6A5RJJ4_9PLEO|nr:MFS general substrate transporter [Didymella exigua CBS 183.55]KAF1927278.1 MFS general substrate transporter [Didymella exigua CBS 183.55]